MAERKDREIHIDLIAELVDVFKEQEFEILGVSGGLGYAEPLSLPNDGYGDQEEKEPDVYAYDKKRRCYIIGEAKTGRGDFETDHALTQYNVYLDQVHKRSGQRSYLYVIVPASKVPEFSSLITHYIHRDFWGKIVLVSSQRQLE
jgi:hypothetical protein